MNATNKLLDKYVAFCSARTGAAPSPSAIATAAGVGRTSIANYRSGFSHAAPHVVRRLAEAIGENPDAWMALVESERARSKADRKAWAAMARNLGAAATVAAVALFWSTSGLAQVIEKAVISGPMHIMSRWLRVLRAETRFAAA